MNIIQLMEIFSSYFEPRESWDNWRVYLKALFAIEMTDAEVAVYRECTNRVNAPVTPFNESWLVCGRRAGKSRIAALIATYAATVPVYKLSRGEAGIVAVLASDRQQAKAIFRYVTGLFESDLLSPMVTRQSEDSIEILSNDTRIIIEVVTSNFRSARGRTIVCALLDETAFWLSDTSASPDTEIVNALRPAMATISGAKLIGLSSPYKKSGILYDNYKRHFGKDGSNVLVWQAASLVMNPSLPKSVVDDALAADPQSARAEYLAQFRDDVSAFVPVEFVETAVAHGLTAIPPISEHTYFGFCDPSGGSSDSFTLAICHLEDNVAVLDYIDEKRPPFSPDAVVNEFAATLKAYRVHEVHGDRYAGEFPRELFRKCGVNYVIADKTRSELYLGLLPLLMSGRVQLLDNAKLITQLCNLERRTSRNGKDTIDHGPGQHDDLANSVAGALVSCAGRSFAPLNLEGFATFGNRDTNREFFPSNYPDYESHVAAMLDDDIDDGEETSSVYGRDSPWS